MSGKTITLLVVTALILLLQGGYLLLDWMRLLPQVDIAAAFDYSSNTKLLVVFLCAFLAWIIGADGLGPSDTRRMGIIFAIIAIADVFLNRNMVAPGISTFCVAQVALIERNSKGFRQSWRDGVLSKRLWYLVAVALVLVVTFTIMLRFFDSHVGVPGLFWLAFVYTMMLSLSALVALAAVWVGYYPRANAIAMSIGMGLFLCCDITVLMRLAFTSTGEDTNMIIASSVTWIFYTPAVYLLAMSGYRRPLAS